MKAPYPSTSWYIPPKKSFWLNHDNMGLRFTVTNALKDLTYYNDMAQHMQAEHAVAAAIQTTLKAACDEGQGARLMPELADVIAQRTH